MIHSAAFRLTLWYLALIMALSVSFSIVLFRVSSNELATSARRQDPLFSALQQGGFLDIQDTREGELREAREHLRMNLYLFNLATLVLGGIASYALARRTLQPLETAMEAQERFASDASHELRTPLAVMETELEVALRDDGLPASELRSTMRSTLEEVTKMKGLTQQLLKLSLPGGAAEPTGQLIELGEAVTAASRALEPVAAHHAITIKNELPTHPLYVRGSTDSLHELLVILLDNAIKYSKSDAVVTARVQRSDGTAKIAVRDTGIGIRSSDIPHIFDRFYRADQSRTKQQVEGYGLGLSIAKQLAGSLGGGIDVTSELGKGSVFTVSLPIADQPPTQV